MYTQKFKYISCYCLSSAEGGRRYPGKIQIHLMLLFIGRLPGYSGNLDLFKYISCYCLSFYGLAGFFRQ